MCSPALRVPISRVDRPVGPATPAARRSEAAADAELDAYVARAMEIVASLETIRPIDFTRDHADIEVAWRVREGMQGLIVRLACRARR